MNNNEIELKEYRGDIIQGQDSSLINKIILRSIQCEDCDYDVLMQVTGLNMAALHQRVSRLKKANPDLTFYSPIRAPRVLKRKK